LNFIARRKIWPAKQARLRAYFAATPNRAVNFIVSQRSKFFTLQSKSLRAAGLNLHRRANSAPQLFS